MTEFLEQLKKQSSLEEEMIQRIRYVLELFLAKTDMAQNEIDDIRNTLGILAEDSLHHEEELRKIIRELET